MIDTFSSDFFRIASDGQIPRSVSGQVLDVDEAGDDFEDCSMATSIYSESLSLAASLPPNPTTPCHRDKRRTRLSRESKAKMKALDQKDKLFGRNESIDCQVRGLMTWTTTHPPKKGHFATSIITTLEKTGLCDYSTGGCSYLEMMVSLIYALQTFSQDNNYVLLIYQTKWKKNMHKRWYYFCPTYVALNCECKHNFKNMWSLSSISSY